MRKLITILLILFCFYSQAASVIYYMSASGNDANSGLSGSPIKTIATVVGKTLYLDFRYDAIMSKMILINSQQY